MFGFLFSVISYVTFLAVFVGMALFSDGLLLPKTVDSAATVPVGQALLINLGLLLLWGFQHSVMARQHFKDWLTRFVPVQLERATYVLVSSLALGFVLYAWQPIDGTLWDLQATPLVAAVWAINALGWLGVPLSSFLIDHFDLFGLKQAFARWRKTSYGSKGFVKPVVYRYVRHPMMTAMMVGLWAAPFMTVSHLCFSLGMTLYIMVGVHFEERALRRELGEAYGAYQASTPKFIPGLGGNDQAPTTPIVERPSQA